MEGLDEFERRIAGGELRLVCDTNVYLDAREAIGVTDEGSLRLALGPACESPAVALLRAPSVAGAVTNFTIAQYVMSELLYLLRDGYDERPVGLGNVFLAAQALRGLIDLHPFGQANKGGPTTEEPLPDPPLAAHERHDRHIWCEAKRTNSILITSDGDLLDAIRQSSGDPTSALTPVQLHTLAAAWLER